MKPFKIKVEDTKLREVVKISGYEGYGFSIQAVFYSQTNPNSRIRFMDADKDECMFPVPGQVEAKVVHLETPVTIKLPLHYFDETSGNTFVVFGQLQKPS